MSTTNDQRRKAAARAAKTNPVLAARRLAVDEIAVDQAQRAVGCVQGGGDHARLVVGVLRDVAHDVGEVGVGKEPPHRIAVERREVTRVELLVVGDEELLGDGPPEAGVEHLLEVPLGRLRRVFDDRELDAAQAALAAADTLVEDLVGDDGRLRELVADDRIVPAVRALVDAPVWAVAEEARAMLALARLYDPITFREGGPLRAERLTPFVVDVAAARQSKPLTPADLKGTPVAPIVDALLLRRGVDQLPGHGLQPAVAVFVGERVSGGHRDDNARDFAQIG